MKHEFQFADGHQTAAASDSGSMQGTFAAELVNADDLARIREEALASRLKTSTATAEEEKMEEEKKKEDGDEERMEQDDAPVVDNNKDATGGPEAGGGSGTTA